jgi:hypothetical protein
MDDKEEVKKCSNCCRTPQSIKEFVNEKGRECSTCAKCRAKGKKHDSKPERREYHNELQKEKEYSKEWKINNPDYIANWSRTHVNARLNSLKHASERRGIEWRLTDEEAKVMLTSPCVYCKHMDLEVRVNGIDRLDSNVCYTTENCRPCCKDCNYMKGTYDPRTFIERAKKIALCDVEFPEVPRCEEHKKINRRAPQPATTPSEPQTPLQ